MEKIIMMEIGSIITIGILAFIGVLFLFGFLRGMRKGLYKSLVDLGFVFVCLILSILISKGITSGIADVESFAGMLESLRGTLGAETTDSILQFVDQVKDDPGMINAVLAIPAAIITPIVFIVVHILLGLIVKIPKLILEKVLFGKNKGPEYRGGNRWIGGAVGGVRNALFIVILLIPIVGYAGFIGDTLDTIVNESENAGGATAVVDKNDNDIVIDFVEDKLDDEAEDTAVDSLIENIKDIQKDLEPIVDNPMVKGINGVGGKLIFRSLTTKRVDGVKISLTKEVDGFAKLYGNISVLTSKDASKDAQKASVNNIKDIIHNAELVPYVTSELISFAAEQWLAGEEVFGYSKPNVGETYQDSIDRLLLTLSTTNKDNIKTDIDTIANIYVICIDEGLIEEMNKEEGELLSVFTKENFVVKLFTEIYNNERTRPAIGFLSNTVREYLVAVYDEVNGTTSPAPEMLDMSKVTLAQVQNDARIISQFTTYLTAFTKSIEDLDTEDPNALIINADVESLGAALDLLKQSLMLGDSYDFLIVAMLKSEAVAELGFVNQELLDRVDDDNFSMKNTLASTQKLAIVALSLNNSTVTKEESKEALKYMITEMTPETAETLKSTVNEDVLKDFGMTEEEAGTISNTINSVIDSMSSATSDMSEEQLEKEAEAVSTLVTVMKDASSSTSGSTANNLFGGENEESKTGMTADSLLETVVSSQVVTDAIVSAGKGENNEKIEDPFGVADSMTESDKTAAENAIKDYYQNNSSENAEENAALKEKLDAVANIFGMDASAWFN